MVKVEDFSDGNASSEHQIGAEMVPKEQAWDFDLPYQAIYSGHPAETVASSSGRNIRSSLIGMGFSPSLVDKVIDEKGEENVDLLVETLLKYPVLQKLHSESSDSLEELFADTKDENSPQELVAESCLKGESEVFVECKNEKRASLLLMNFSVAEVDSAIDKIGEDASIDELVDFIAAAQLAENTGKDDDLTRTDRNDIEEDDTEALFGTMDKTVWLLEMGFTENEISLAIDKFGSELPVSELADSIFAGRIFDTCAEEDKNWITAKTGHPQAGSYYRSPGRGIVIGMKRYSDAYCVKSEKYDDLQLRSMGVEDSHKGKRPKQEHIDHSSTSHGTAHFEDIKPMQESKGLWTATHCSLHGAREGLNRSGVPKLSKSYPSRSFDEIAAKAPFFFYGNVMDVSTSNWGKMSQFLYAREPEFVSTKFFSALCRKEGYIHNLPTESRIHILPKPPMSIEDAMPHTKKWWPSWDTRKQLNSISSEITGLSQLCDRLGKTLMNSQGSISTETQKDILHHCLKWNLLWVGKHKLAPIEPEDLELILGYPQHHTQDAAISLMERLNLLKQSFQTDTLGYHLSVLKCMFPEGLTILSIYSGIGGAIVSLHRLGIKIRGVVSVETLELNRRILLRWWENSGQKGELVQIEDIQKLASSKLESLVKKFGGFDLVVCQNSCNLPLRNSRMLADGGNFAGFDFTQFCEFVRVLQVVRSKMERS